MDGHAAFTAPVEDENALQKSITPFQKGGEGDLNYSYSVIARSVLCDVAISATQYVTLMSLVSFPRRIENLIFFNTTIQHIIKDES